MENFTILRIFDTKFVLSSQTLVYVQSFTILMLVLLILQAFKVHDFIRAWTSWGEKFQQQKGNRFVVERKIYSTFFTYEIEDCY